MKRIVWAILSLTQLESELAMGQSHSNDRKCAFLGQSSTRTKLSPQTPISQLGWPSLLRYAIAQAYDFLRPGEVGTPIHVLGDLQSYTAVSLLRIPKVGKLSVQHVRDTLALANLKLAGDEFFEAGFTPLIAHYLYHGKKSLDDLATLDEPQFYQLIPKQAVNLWQAFDSVRTRLIKTRGKASK